MPEPLVHLAQYSDGLPLCWDEDQVRGAPDPNPSALTREERKVTCEACLHWLGESDA